MKKNFLLSVVMALIMSLTTVAPAQAQRHLYKRIEIGTGNMWSFIGTTVISAFVNTAVKYPLVDVNMRFSSMSSDYDNLQGLDNVSYDYDSENGEEYDAYKAEYAKFDARHLFNHLIGGVKIGYLTDKQGFFNYCAYGSAHYNLRQLKLMDGDDYTRLNTQRLQVGGGLMLVMGSIEKKTRFIVDAGLRYNIPAYFSGDDIEGGCSNLNAGLSSHYSFRVSWNNSVSTGFNFDMMHYDLFKNEDLCGDKSKIYEFGLTITLLFKEL